MDFFPGFGRIGVGNAAFHPILLVHEHHRTQCVIGLVTQRFQYPHRLDGLHAARTVVVRALGEVPRIEVTTYGNVPYSEALNIESAFPKYDDANAIYLDLIKRLTDASAALNPAAGGFGDADVLYGSNINRWKKLANTSS